MSTSIFDTSRISGHGEWMRGIMAERVSINFKERASMIQVVAVISAKPGMRDSVLQAFQANVPAVLAEQGCIEYGAAIDVENGPKFQKQFGPDTFVVIEKWESMDALKAHGAAPHMAAYAAKTKEMLESRAIYILSPV
jgi:quinol monooxygenase YgiN